jgi:transposase
LPPPTRRGEGESGATLEQFFDQLGPARSTRIEAASADPRGGYARVIASRAPEARICADPFHVINIANLAVDEVRHGWGERREHRRPNNPGEPAMANPAEPRRPADQAHPIGPAERLATWTDHHREQITQLRRARHVLVRAWVLKEALRDLYRLPSDRRPDAYFYGRLARASRSRIPAVVNLSRTIRKHRTHILAAVDPGILCNSKLEGLNSNIRLINHRGYGPTTPADVICNDLPVLLRSDDHAAPGKVKRTIV